MADQGGPAHRDGERHLCPTEQVAQVGVGGEVDRHTDEHNAVGRPVEHGVEKGAVRRRPIGEPGDLTIAAVEHAGQRDQQGRGDRSPQREAGGRRHRHGERR